MADRRSRDWVWRLRRRRTIPKAPASDGGFAIPPTVTSTQLPQTRRPRAALRRIRRSLPSFADVRESVLALPVYRPRWRPWSPLRAALTTLGFAFTMGVLVLVTYRVRPTLERIVIAMPRMLPQAAATVIQDALVPPRRAEHRADRALVRENRSPVAGGLLSIPPAFSSDDGAYDLLIHFHGNTALVEESISSTQLNAVLVQVNLGIGSGPLRGPLR